MTAAVGAVVGGCAAAPQGVAAPASRALTPSPSAAASSVATTPSPPHTAATMHAPPVPTTSRPTATTASPPRAPARTARPRTTPTPTPTTQPPPTPAPTPPPAPSAPPAPTLLPDQMASTGSARQIITVTNDGSGTLAVLRAFELDGGAWRQMFGPTTVHIGAEGFSRGFSESNTHSPIGYYTLTQAFGNSADPGSRLPYHHVGYGDRWVDQVSSPNYNTMQTGDADKSRGDGEALWTVVPEYDYAVVVDYNRSPVVHGAGSAVFLHVTDGAATAGCVSMPATQLIALLRWLSPSMHPRVAMGPLADVLSM